MKTEMAPSWGWRGEMGRLGATARHFYTGGERRTRGTPRAKRTLSETTLKGDPEKEKLEIGGGRGIGEKRGGTDGVFTKTNFQLLGGTVNRREEGLEKTRKNGKHTGTVR